MVRFTDPFWWAQAACVFVIIGQLLSIALLIARCVHAP